MVVTRLLELCSIASSNSETSSEPATILTISLGSPGRQKYPSQFHFQQFHWHVDAYIPKISQNKDVYLRYNKFSISATVKKHRFLIDAKFDNLKYHSSPHPTAQKY